MNKIIRAIRTAELSSVASSLLQIYSQYQMVLKDEFLDEQFTEFAKLEKQLNISIKQNRTTSSLKEKDDLRKSKLSALNSILKGYMSVPIADKSESATKLYKIFSKYGTKVNQKGFEEASGLIQSLLTDLYDENLQNDIDNLDGFSIALDALNKANDEFNSTNVNYTDEISAENRKTTASELKFPTLDIVNKNIVPYLSALKNVEKYKKISNAIEQLIDDINVKIRTRKTRNDNEEMSKTSKSKPFAEDENLSNDNIFNADEA